MIKTVAAGTLLASAFLMIQTTWLKNGLFWGVIPDFSFLVVGWITYKNKGHEGLWIAFLTGLVCDLLSSSPLGYFSFVLVVPTYLIALTRKSIAIDSFFMPVLLGFFGTLAKAFASILLLGIFGSSRINAYSLSDLKLWIEAALNGALAPLFFYLLRQTKGIFVTKGPTE